jgi:AcrR family transcriptional regulator
VTTAPSKRLTRAESRERTRMRIIDAATVLFLRGGFQASSLEQVADEAGYTVGAVYSNFESKTALGVAVIDELYACEEQRLADSLAKVPAGDTDGVFDVLATWADSTIGDLDWTRLEIEIAAFSANDKSYRAATAARHARLRARCRELIAGRLGGESPLAPELLATVIVGLALGIGAQRAADPSIPGRAWSEGLRALVR